jgi:hypothetical protein
LYAAHVAWPGDILTGDVLTVGEQGQRIVRSPVEPGQYMSPSGIGNVLLPHEFLDESDLQFGVEFNSTGGEDTDYLVRACSTGRRIRAVPAAIVIEHWPASRWTFQARAEREQRSAATYVQAMPPHWSWSANRLFSAAQDLFVASYWLGLSLVAPHGGNRERGRLLFHKCKGTIQGIRTRLSSSRS